MNSSGSRSSGSSGKKHHLRILFPEVRVTEIRFESVVDIWYTRIPDKRITYVLHAPSETVHDHLNPPQTRPASGDPHWRKVGVRGNNAAELSWPAVYIREGVSGNPSRKLMVSFEAEGNPSYSGDIAIKATSSLGVNIGERNVTFSGGRATDVAFDLQNIPTTVKWLSGIEFVWWYKILPKGTRFYEANHTQHTLFIIDQESEEADLKFQDRFLFEILDWACRWADGSSGHQAVFNAIWNHFDPVTAKHDTGFVYWKKWREIETRYGVSAASLIAQDLEDAIQSQDNTDPLLKSAVSCIVFDRLLINCLAVHGIRSAEIKVVPPGHSFSRGGKDYYCTGWKAKTTWAQGNKKAPPSWGSHWIADVLTHRGDWKIYDASYGGGPSDCEAPTGRGSTVDLRTYEPSAVDLRQSFLCENLTDGRSDELPRSTTHPPHLTGVVLWEN